MLALLRTGHSRRRPQLATPTPRASPAHLRITQPKPDTGSRKQKFSMHRHNRPVGVEAVCPDRGCARPRTSA